MACALCVTYAGAGNGVGAAGDVRGGDMMVFDSSGIHFTLMAYAHAGTTPALTDTNTE